MSFAEKLKYLREQNEMTQEYVASRLNVSRSTIAGYETKNRQPSHEKLTALAALFQVSVDYLLDNQTDIVQLSPSRAPLPDASETDLLVRYQNLSPRSRMEILDFMQFLEFRDQQKS